MIPFYYDGMVCPINSPNDQIMPWYYIDTNANIFSTKTNKYLTPQLTHNGYLQVHLITESGEVCRKIHRLVLLTFNYFPGCESLQVNHINGNKLRNDIYNLEWVTPKQNTQHAILHNLRNSVGEDNPNAKITQTQAIEIIDHLLAGENDIDISKVLGVPVSIIQEIARGNTWTHLTNTCIEKIKSTRRGYHLSDLQYNAVCKYYEENIQLLKNFNTVKEFIISALVSAGVEVTETTLRIGKRLYYRYDKPEITSKYIY